MAQLRQDYSRFKQKDAEIIAVGPEGQDELAQFWHREQIPFIGLPDPEHAIANQYGQQVKLLRLGRMPAIVIVDKQGKVRYSHYGDSMSDIPTSEELLDVLDRINQEKETQS